MSRLNPRYKINLIQIFNRAFKDHPPIVKRQLRESLNDVVFKSTFSKLVIEEIIDRTQNQNIDKNGVNFIKYSRSYVESDVFEIYAKSPDEVNMTLTGEMMASLTSKFENSSISIELIGSANKAKASGAVYGIKTKRGLVVRDFLGLPEDVEDKIMKEAMTISRGSDFQAVSGFFENTSLADNFGQVGGQREFTSRIFTTDVLTLLARALNGNSNG